MDDPSRPSAKGLVSDGKTSGNTYVPTISTASACADERPAVVAEHVAEVAAEERMRVVDVDLGRVRAPDVRAEQLGDVGQLGLGTRHRDAVAHDDDGTFGAGQQRRRLRHERGLRDATASPASTTARSAPC